MPRVEMEISSAKGALHNVVWALCDTGASVSILSGETARRLNVTLEKTTPTVIKLASADDREIPMLGEAEVWVRSNNQYRRKIRVAIVDGLDEQLIVGFDHLKMLGFLPSDWPTQMTPKSGEDGTQRCFTIKSEIEKVNEVSLEMDEKEDLSSPEECVDSEACLDLFPGEETWTDIPNLENLPKRVQEIMEKYKKVFSNKLRKGQHINWPEVEVELLEGAKYPRSVTRARQPPAALYDQAHGIIKDLLQEGIIVPVTEPTTYNSAAFFLPKASDKSKARFVSDQRATNSIIRRPHHPAYDPQQLIRTMAPNLTHYWVMDMSQSYHQLKISERSSKEFFNILTAFGSFRFTRVIQGCSISSDILGQAMEHRFSDLLGTQRLTRDMDDWISGARSEEEAIDQLEVFLKRCSENNIILSPRKFQWSGAGGKVKWAGLEVQQGTSRPDPDRVKALACFEEPYDKQSLRRWLGAANTLGAYISGLSQKTALQRELLKKETAWIWSEETSKEFKELRSQLSDPKCLFTYNRDMDVGVSIDCQSGGKMDEDNPGKTGLGFHCFQYYRDEEKAKATGLGGPLGRKGWNKVQSLQFGSIAAKQSWRNKAAMIVELLGTISALYKLEYFTRGQKIIDLFLDSKPIVQAWTNKSLDSLSPALQPLLIELARWPLRLHWVQGKKHLVADALGRAAVDEEGQHHPGVEQAEEEFPHLSGGAAGEYTLSEVGETFERLFHVIATQGAEEDIGEEHLAWELAFTELFEEATTDQEYAVVCDRVEQGMKLAEVKKSHPKNPVRSYVKIWDQLSILSNSQGARLLIIDNQQVVVPKKMRKKLLQRVHAHHKGVQLTKAFLERYYFWPDLNNQVKDLCNNCTTCEEFRPAKPKEIQPQMFRPSKPWEAVAADFFTFQNKQILLLVDMLTNYIVLLHFIAAPSTTQILTALDNTFIINGGFPSIVATDGQLSLNSKEFNDYCNEKWIVHRVSSPHNSGSNGCAERSIREVRRTFNKAAREKGNTLTKSDMAEILSLLNDTPRGSNRASPSFLHFRRSFRHPHFPALRLQKPESFFEEQQEERRMEKDKRSEDFNDKVSRFNPSVLHLEVGMRVLIQDKHGRFIIPGEVIQLRSKRSCYVRNLDSGNLMLRNRRFLRKDPAHQTPYIQDDDDDDEEPVRRADRGIQRLNKVKSIMKPNYKRNSKHANVTFSVDMQGDVKQEEGSEEVSVAEPPEENTLDTEKEQVAKEEIERLVADGVIEICKEEIDYRIEDWSGNLEEITDRLQKDNPAVAREIKKIDKEVRDAHRVELFIQDWQDYSPLVDISCSFKKCTCKTDREKERDKEQQNLDRIRLAGIKRRRSNPVDLHAQHCHDCGALSIGLPSHVKQCDSDTGGHRSLQCKFDDFVQEPSNLVWKAFHDRILNAPEL